MPLSRQFRLVRYPESTTGLRKSNFRHIQRLQSSKFSFFSLSNQVPIQCTVWFLTLLRSIGLHFLATVGSFFSFLAQPRIDFICRLNKAPSESENKIVSIIICFFEYENIRYRFIYFWHWVIKRSLNFPLFFWSSRLAMCPYSLIVLTLLIPAFLLTSVSSSSGIGTLETVTLYYDNFHKHVLSTSSGSNLELGLDITEMEQSLLSQTSKSGKKIWNNSI